MNVDVVRPLLCQWRVELTDFLRFILCLRAAPRRGCIEVVVVHRGEGRRHGAAVDAQAPRAAVGARQCCGARVKCCGIFVIVFVDRV